MREVGGGHNVTFLPRFRLDDEELKLTLSAKWQFINLV